MRHPNERGRQRELRQVVFLAVREALNAPAHPDSKRQDKRKQRDLQRYGSRVLKAEGFYSCPARKTNKRREFKEMQRRIWEEQKHTALNVARRLQGREVWSKQLAVPVDAIALGTYIHQHAEIALPGGIHA